jgi:uncharacterized protein (TIGR01244 family)
VFAWTGLPPPEESAVDIRPITPDYAVSPQIDPEDFPAIAAAGYRTVIDNRPDAEIPASHHAMAMRRAAEAAGLVFVFNPVIGGMLTEENVAAQGAAIAASDGPVLAYCASGNRSSIVWALSQAGTRPTDELIGLPARHGYQLEGLRPMIEALSAQRA